MPSVEEMRSCSPEDDELAIVQSFITKDAKIFLKQTHASGYLNELASWSGEYHLCLVTETYDPTTNTFKVQWNRGCGGDGDGASNSSGWSAAAVSTFTLVSSDQVLIIPLESTEVSIEDDDNGNKHYNAKIIDTCCKNSDEASDMVRIRWDRGDEQMVYNSQVSFGSRGRRRRRNRGGDKVVSNQQATKKTATASSKRRAAKGTTAARRQASKHGKASTALLPGEKKNRTLSTLPNKKFNKKSTGIMEDIEIISIPSSSSSEDEPSIDNRKRPWEGSQGLAFSASPTTTATAAAKRSKVTRTSSSDDDNNNIDEGDDLMDKQVNDFLTSQGFNNDTDGVRAAAAASPTSGFNNLFSEEDLQSHLVNYQARKPSSRNTADLGSSILGLDSGGENVRQEEGRVTEEENNSKTTAATQREEASLAVSQEGGASNHTAVSQWQISTDGASHNAMSSGVDAGGDEGGKHSDDESIHSEEAGGEDQSLYTQGDGSDESMPSTLPSCEEESDLDTSDILQSSKRVPRKISTKMTNATLNKRPPTRTSPRKVTPQKRTAATTSSSSSPTSGGYDNEMAAATAPASSKRRIRRKDSDNKILLQGFCTSIDEGQRGKIQSIISVLKSALNCKEDSDESNEALLDANALLHESLFNVADRTQISKAPSSNVEQVDQASNGRNDGNKCHIVRLAKHFSLKQAQIDHVFAKLGKEDGYYSINDAIPLILERRSDRENSNDPIATVAKTSKTPLDSVIGSRVRTIFEDGNEHEGTISTVHYRVKYDDGDTETFLTEAEVFENLVCNGHIHHAEDTRCSMLEIFSGCSLLSTMCKRKGMDVVSIDNDMNSNATIKADFSSGYVQSLISSKAHDYIHASPVCSTYSMLAGGRHRGSEQYNKTPQSHEADGNLTSLYFVIANVLKANPQATVTIENPRAWMRKGNIAMKLFEENLGFKRCIIHYCQFGRGDQKPTNIWTNDEKLGQILENIGGKCKCRVRHEEGVRNQGHEKNFAALPFKLCQIISSYVHSKHTQLKFEQIAAGGVDGTALDFDPLV